MEKSVGSFVHVWHLKWSHHQESKLRKWIDQLSDEEKIKADRFVYDRDRRRYIISHGFLRSVLSKYFNRAPREIQFGEGVHNKPFILADQGSNLHFNLSHALDVAVVAVSDRPVGIDIEYIDANFPFAEVISQFMSEKEKSDFLRLSPSQQMKAFYYCWTRKEAYVKALGHGLSYPIRKITVPIKEESIQSWIDENQPNEPKQWHMNHLSYLSGYVGAVVHQASHVVFAD